MHRQNADKKTPIHIKVSQVSGDWKDKKHGPWHQGSLWQPIQKDRWTQPLCTHKWTQSLLPSVWRKLRVEQFLSSAVGGVLSVTAQATHGVFCGDELSPRHWRKLTLTVIQSQLLRTKGKPAPLSPVLGPMLHSLSNNRKLSPCVDGGWVIRLPFYLAKSQCLV